MFSRKQILTDWLQKDPLPKALRGFSVLDPHDEFLQLHVHENQKPHLWRKADECIRDFMDSSLVSVSFEGVWATDDITQRGVLLNKVGPDFLCNILFMLYQ